MYEWSNSKKELVRIVLNRFFWHKYLAKKTLRAVLGVLEIIENGKDSSNNGLDRKEV